MYRSITERKTLGELITHPDREVRTIAERLVKLLGELERERMPGRRSIPPRTLRDTKPPM